MSDSPDENTPRTRLGDFTPQADAYRVSRPSYPSALIDRLVQTLNLPNGAHVADIGAGTGIFTAQLAERGFKVTAVEPNPAMSTKAMPHPNVRWVEGAFEQMPVPDASQHWATAAQAFHWADASKALPEVHRILKPGGAFTVLWNNRLNDDEPTLARAWSLIRSAVPDFDDNYRDNRDWPTVLTSTGHFQDVSLEESRHVIEMPRERFVALWQSHNRLTTTAGPTLFKELIERIERDLDEHNVTSVPMPYLCRAWTVRRRDV